MTMESIRNKPVWRTAFSESSRLAICVALRDLGSWQMKLSQTPTHKNVIVPITEGRSGVSLLKRTHLTEVHSDPL